MEWVDAVFHLNYAAKAKALFYRYSVVVSSTCSTDQYFSPRVYVFVALFTSFFVLNYKFIYFSGICTSKTTSSNKHCGHLLTGTLQPRKLELSRELQYTGEYFFCFYSCATTPFRFNHVNIVSERLPALLTTDVLYGNFKFITARVSFHLIVSRD